MLLTEYANYNIIMMFKMETYMKKTLLFLAILPLLLISAYTYGEEVSPEPKKAESKFYKFNTHEFEIGYNPYYFRYEEPDIDVKLTGYLHGLYLGYTFRPKDFMFRGTADLAGFKTRYDGGYQSGASLEADSDDYLMEYRAVLGYSFPFLKTTKITPYIGFGYRYWHNKVQATGAYTREVSYLYTPVGFEHVHEMHKNWFLGFGAEYDLLWYGQVKSYLSDVSPLLNDVINKQENLSRNYGVRAFVFVRWKPGKFALQIEPYFHYWHVEQSSLADVTYSGTLIGFAYEPKNTTEEYGVRVSVVF